MAAMEKAMDQYFATRNRVTRACALRDLFWATDRWLASDKSGPEGAACKGRIEELFKIVVIKLCDTFKVSENMLPNKLEVIFPNMKAPHAGEDAYYLKANEVEQFRLTFKKGMLYRWKVAGENQLDLVPVNTGENDIRGLSGADCPQECFCQAGFVMSIWDELYMTQHFKDGMAFGEANLPTPAGVGLQQSFFHSNYMAGERVVCAGEMTIRNGVVKRLSNNSGHYRPAAYHMQPVLWFLQKKGVDLGSAEVALLVPAKNQADKDRFLKCSAFTYLTKASTVKVDGPPAAGVSRWIDNYPNNPTWLPF